MAIQYDPPLGTLMDFFCMEPHQGFPEEEIQQAEARLGASLPAVYRDFLRKYGKDKINFYFNQLQEPAHIDTTYEILEEELEEWAPEFQEAVRDGREAAYDGNAYFQLWQLPKERWGGVTDNYVIIWYENQGVWSAGYRLQDLLDGVPDPPVYGSTEDDYVTYAKWTGNTEDFLREMLRQAGDGWYSGRRVREDGAIRSILEEAGADPEALQPHPLGANGDCWLAVFLDLEREQAGFCFAGGEDQEVLLLPRLPRPAGNHSTADQLAVPSTSRLNNGVFQYKPINKGPYRLDLRYWQKKDLGMDAPKPENGIALHPLIALLVQEAFHHTPATAYDWGKDLGRLKTLRLELRHGTCQAIDEDDHAAYLYPPGMHFPPPPYYFDLHDWSIIRRMTALRTFFLERILIDDDGFWPALAKLPNLRNLSIQSTWVGDFSFLQDCKNLTRLSLYNTGFSDCRLLAGLSKLQELDLRFCRLEHTDALNALHCKYIGYPKV